MVRRVRAPVRVLRVEPVAEVRLVPDRVERDARQRRPGLGGVGLQRERKRHVRVLGRRRPGRVAAAADRVRARVARADRLDELAELLRARAARAGDRRLGRRPVGREPAELEDHAHPARTGLAHEAVVRRPRVGRVVAGSAPSKSSGLLLPPGASARQLTSTFTTSTPSASISSSASRALVLARPAQDLVVPGSRELPLARAARATDSAAKRDGCEDECQEASSHRYEVRAPRNHAEPPRLRSSENLALRLPTSYGSSGNRAERAAESPPTVEPDPGNAGAEEG